MTLRIILPLLLMSMLLCSCGADKTENKTSDLTAYFPQSFPEMPFERAPELATFRGDEIEDYLADPQPILDFNFSDMATSNYRDNEVEIAIDLYRFATAADAWGYFMTTLPEKPYRVPLGLDAHTTNYNLHFVKGRFVAKLVVYQDERKFRMGMRYAAIALEKLLPGDTAIPPEFDLFPSEARIEEEIAFHGQDFLGFVVESVTLPGFGREHADVFQNAHGRNTVDNDLTTLAARAEGDVFIAAPGRGIGLGRGQDILFGQTSGIHHFFQRLCLGGPVCHHSTNRDHQKDGCHQVDQSHARLPCSAWAPDHSKQR